ANNCLQLAAAATIRRGIGGRAYSWNRLAGGNIARRDRHRMERPGGDRHQRGEQESLKRGAKHGRQYSEIKSSPALKLRSAAGDGRVFKHFGLSPPVARHASVSSISTATTFTGSQPQAR